MKPPKLLLPRHSYTHVVALIALGLIAFFVIQNGFPRHLLQLILIFPVSLLYFYLSGLRYRASLLSLLFITLGLLVGYHWKQGGSTDYYRRDRIVISELGDDLQGELVKKIVGEAEAVSKNYHLTEARRVSKFFADRSEAIPFMQKHKKVLGILLGTTKHPRVTFPTEIVLRDVNNVQLQMISLPEEINLPYIEPVHANHFLGFLSESLSPNSRNRLDAAKWIAQYRGQYGSGAPRAFSLFAYAKALLEVSKSPELAIRQYAKSFWFANPKFDSCLHSAAANNAAVLAYELGNSQKAHSYFSSALNVRDKQCQGVISARKNLEIVTHLSVSK